MNIKLLDLYSDYLLSSFSATTATGLSRLMDDDVSHDQVSRMLNSRRLGVQRLVADGQTSCAVDST